MWGCSFSSLDSVYVNIFFRICIVFIEKDPVGDIFKLNCSQFACLCFDAYKCQLKMCKAIQLYYAYINRFFSSILCRIYFTHRFYTYLYDYWNKVQLKYELVCKSSKSNSIIMQIIRFFSLTPFGSVRFFFYVKMRSECCGQQFSPIKFSMHFLFIMLKTHIRLCDVCSSHNIM